MSGYIKYKGYSGIHINGSCNLCKHIIKKRIDNIKYHLTLHHINLYKYNYIKLFNI